MSGARSCVALIAAALGALATAPAPAEDARAVETQRVVVRVQSDSESRGHGYVFVDHQDGEPILLDSVVAERGYLGVGLLELTPELRRHFGAPPTAGVMVSRVEPESPAARAGLRAGDVLTAIDGEAVASASAVVRKVAEAEDGQRVELDVRRNGEPTAITATLATRPRRQLDLGGLIRFSGRPRGARPFEPPPEALPLIELDPETMGRALGALREHLDGEEWRRRLQALGGDRERLERRIGELEKRLRELERQLGELPE